MPCWVLHSDREGEVTPDSCAFWKRAGARLIPVPVTKGGQLDPKGMLSALGLDRLADAPRFQLAEATPVGGDVMHRWVRRADR